MIRISKWLTYFLRIFFKKRRRRKGRFKWKTLVADSRNSRVTGNFQSRILQSRPDSFGLGYVLVSNFPKGLSQPGSWPPATLTPAVTHSVELNESHVTRTSQLTTVKKMALKLKILTIFLSLFFVDLIATENFPFSFSLCVNGSFSLLRNQKSYYEGGFYEVAAFT